MFAQRLYELGQYYELQGDEISAGRAYSEAGQYEDAIDKAYQCANAAYNAEDYEAVKDMYAKISSYVNVDKEIEECDNAIAEIVGIHELLCGTFCRRESARMDANQGSAGREESRTAHGLPRSVQIICFEPIKAKADFKLKFTFAFSLKSCIIEVRTVPEEERTCSPRNCRSALTALKSFARKIFTMWTKPA